MIRRLRPEAFLPRPLRRFLRREDGNGAIEFVLMLPLIMYVFMAAFESGLYMTRRIILERAVDLTVRNLRLGAYTNPDTNLLKTEICKLAKSLPSCNSSIRIELVPVSTTTWALPTSGVTCINRNEQIQPALTFNPGASNQLMLVRVCSLQDAIFPGTGIGQILTKNNQGGYAVTAVSSYVNEP